MNKQKLEILAPAGDMERLCSALEYGADAVYLGGKIFGMRANPSNFGKEELKEACRLSHEKGVKVYLTVNTLPRQNELPQLPQFLLDAQEAGVDYSKGKEFLVEGTHTVLATEEELARWTKKDQEIAK